MQLGALIPFGDIGDDPTVSREYTQAAESIGYDFIEAPDHVLGQNPAGVGAGERIADGLRGNSSTVPNDMFSRFVEKRPLRGKGPRLARILPTQ